MNLAIYDISLDGHRASHIRAIAGETVKRGWRAMVVLPPAVRSHQAVDSICSIVGGKNVHFSEHPVPVMSPRVTAASLVSYHLLQRRAAARALRSIAQQVDFLYFPTLDYMDKAISVLGSPIGSVPMGGMCMRVRFHMESMGIDSRAPGRASLVGKLGFRLLLNTKGIKCITTADPSLAEYLSGQTASEFRKVRFVPEIGMDHPSVSASDGKRFFGFDQDDRVILVYGLISSRKGIPELIAAVSRLKNERIRLLVLGKVDDDFQEFMNGAEIQSLTASGRLVLRPTYADRDTENAAFAAADAVWVAYRDHSMMSGVFLQAVCSGVPVITANYGVLPWLASRYRVGISVSPADADSTARGIKELFQDENLRETYRCNAARMAEEHRPGQFGKAVCDAIAASLP